jgi:hypothetical protein
MVFNVHDGFQEVFKERNPKLFSPLFGFARGQARTDGAHLDAGSPTRFPIGRRIAYHPAAIAG